MGDDDIRKSTTDLLEEYSRIFGLTFKEYAHALRVREIMDELRRRGAFGDTKRPPELALKRLRRRHLRVVRS